MPQSQVNDVRSSLTFITTSAKLGRWNKLSWVKWFCSRVRHPRSRGLVSLAWLVLSSGFRGTLSAITCALDKAGQIETWNQHDSYHLLSSVCISTSTCCTNSFNKHYGTKSLMGEVKCWHLLALKPFKNCLKMICYTWNKIHISNQVLTVLHDLNLLQTNFLPPPAFYTSATLSFLILECINSFLPQDLCTCCPLLPGIIFYRIFVYLTRSHFLSLPRVLIT